jgi:hypothetical protein
MLLISLKIWRLLESGFAILALLRKEKVRHMLKDWGLRLIGTLVLFFRLVKEC